MTLRPFSGGSGQIVMAAKKINDALDYYRSVLGLQQQMCVYFCQEAKSKQWAKLSWWNYNTVQDLSEFQNDQTHVTETHLHTDGCTLYIHLTTLITFCKHFWKQVKLLQCRAFTPPLHLRPNWTNFKLIIMEPQVGERWTLPEELVIESKHIGPLSMSSLFV